MLVAANVLIDWMKQWDPANRPTHCSNCSHAHVRGDDWEPIAFCVHDHGQSELGRLIRPQHPIGFREAGKCGEFEAAG